MVLLCGSSIIAPAQGDSLPKIGYLGFGAATPPTFFQKRMRELGYSEGKDVEVEYRFADGRPENLPALARELVDAKVNVIVAIGDEAIVAAKNATRTIPIAMVACDAVTTGFVASLARPGGNLTGVTCLTSELMPKRMGIFRELLPSASRVVVLFNPENVSKPPEAARTVELATGTETLDFLGYSFRFERDLKGRPWRYLNLFPSRKSMGKERDKIRELTCPRQGHKPVSEVIEELNEHLRGWKNYFKIGYCRREFRKINYFVRRRMIQHLHRRSQRGYNLPKRINPYAYLDQLGLMQL